MSTVSLARLERNQEGIRRAYEQDLLEVAEKICVEDLTCRPDQPQRLHLLGLLVARRGLIDYALACMTRAATLAPTCAEYVDDLGDLLLRARRPLEAAEACQRALALGNASTETELRFAQALIASGRQEQGLASVHGALDRDPTRADVLMVLGRTYAALKRWAEAREYFARAVRREPGNPMAYAGLGQAMLLSREWRLAEATFARGLKLAPDRPELHVGVGQAQLRLGACDEALRSLQTAVRLAPRDVEACRALVTVLDALGRRNKAIGAWFSLGEALESQDRRQEAAAAYREVQTRKPDHLKAQLGSAYLHLQSASPGRARPYFDRVLALRPEHTEAHQGLGWAAALAGDYKQQWDAVHWRYRHGFERRSFEQPLWDGSPLAGRTILLWSDSAISDTLLLMRFAPLVFQRGARLVVECDRPLVPLMRRMPCVSIAVARRSPLPAFDVHAPIELLPGIFNTRATMIPDAVPYLISDPDREREWLERLPPRGRFTVGLTWAVDRHQRHTGKSSIPLALFEPLARVPDVTFISLQGGAARGELVAPPPGLRITGLPPDQHRSLDDLAAIMRHLDLAIGVDAAGAHLAGALGVSAWTLLPTLPRWPWWGHADRTPWYPTMRLFRQTTRDTWRDVTRRVGRALGELVRTER